MKSAIAIPVPSTKINAHLPCVVLPGHTESFYLVIVLLNPPDEVVLEGTGNNLVCSGLSHFGAFDGH